jgi:hypothetical protein
MTPPGKPAAIGAMHGGGASGAGRNRTTGLHSQRHVANGSHEYISMLVDTAPNSGSPQPLSDNAAARQTYLHYLLLATGHRQERRRTIALF